MRANRSIATLVALALLVGLVGGSGPSGAAEPGTTASFTPPGTELVSDDIHDVAVDAVTGRVFVSGGDRIEVLAADGTYETALTGVGDTRGLDIADGRLHIVDVADDVVRIIDTTSLAEVGVIDLDEDLVGEVSRRGDVLWVLSRGVYGSRLVSHDLGDATTVARPLGASIERLEPDDTAPDRFVGWTRNGALVWSLDGSASSPIVATAEAFPTEDVAVHDGSAYVVRGPNTLVNGSYGPRRYSLPDLTLTSPGVTRGLLHIEIDGDADVRTMATRDNITVSAAAGGSASHFETVNHIAAGGLVPAPDGQWFYAVESRWNGATSAYDARKLIAFPTPPTVRSMKPGTVATGVPTTVELAGSGLRATTAAAIDGADVPVWPLGPEKVLVEVPGSLGVGPHDLSLTSRFGTATTTLEVVADTGADVLGTVRDATGTPVPDAAVSLQGGGLVGTRTATTDARGNYWIGQVPLGDDYRLHVSAGPAWVDQEVTAVQATPNLTTRVDVLLGAPPSGADGDRLATTTLPYRGLTPDPTLYRGLVHDPTTGRNFVGRSDGSVVLDDRLRLIATVSTGGSLVGPRDGAVLALSGGDQWTPGRIDRIDPATLEVTDRWSLGRTAGGEPRQARGPFEVAAGRAWVPTSDGSMIVDLSTGAVTPLTSVGSIVRLTAVDGAPDELVSFDGNDSHRWDASTDPPTLLSSYPGSQVAAASAELGLVWTTRGDELDLVTGAPTGRSHPSGLGSNDVAATSAASGVVAWAANDRTVVRGATGGAVTHELPGSQEIELVGDAPRLLDRSGLTVTLRDLSPRPITSTPNEVVTGVPTEVRITGTGLGGVTGASTAGLDAGMAVEGPGAVVVRPDPATPEGTSTIELESPYGTGIAIVPFVENTGAGLVGTVTGPDGPVTGAMVTLRGSALADPRTTTTDVDGDFSLDDLPYGDDYRLLVVDPSGVHRAQVVSGFEVRPNGQRRVDVRLSAAASGAVDGRFPTTDLGSEPSSLSTLEGIGIVAILGHEVVVLDDVGRLVARVVDRRGATDATVLDGDLWVRVDGVVERIDPTTWAVTDVVATPPSGQRDIAAAGGRLWVVAGEVPGDRHLVAIDPATSTATTTMPLWWDARLTGIEGTPDRLFIWGTDLRVVDVDPSPVVVVERTDDSTSWGADDMTASAAVGAAFGNDGYRIALDDLAWSSFAEAVPWAGVAATDSGEAVAIGGSVHFPDTSLRRVRFGGLDEPRRSAWSSDDEVLLVADDDGVVTPWLVTPTVVDADPSGVPRNAEAQVTLHGRVVEPATSVLVAGVPVALADAPPLGGDIAITIPASVTDVPPGTPLPIELTTPLGTTTADDVLVVGPTRPDAPDGMVVGGWAGVVVSWQAPDDDGGSPVTGYDVRISDEVAHLGATELAPLATSWGWTLWRPGPLPAVPTRVTVRAVNAEGPGPWAEAGEIVPDDGPGVFTDISPTNPLWAEVNAAATTYRITTGFDDGTFRPTEVVSRQAAVTFLWRAAGSPTGFPEPGFADVPATNPFRPAIAWAVATGVTTGYADGTFRPTDAVSRQSWLAFQHRAAGAPTGPFPDPGFSDVPATHPFALPIAWAVDQDITTGYADGTFRPTIPVTRQAAVAFLVRPTWPTWEPAG